MSRRSRAAAALAALLLASGCRTIVRPEPAAIAPWTAQLRDSQPDDAFAAIYRLHGRTLVFVAANHENASDSPTFRLIEALYAATHVDTLIAEGFPYAWGANSERIRTWFARQTEVDGFVEGGETVPAIRGAIAQHARIWGGEAGDSEVRARVVAEGFSSDDLLGFYVLRVVPQWEREHQIDNAADPRLAALVDAELARNRKQLGLGQDVLPGHAEWLRWYEATNGKPLDARFDVEEVGPRADGRFRTNAIAAAIGHARDSFLLETIATHLNAREDVMVVFGASHLMMLRPALDRMLGAPCYTGSAVRAAPGRCLR